MTLVLLVQPPIEDFYLTKKRTVPYGLLSIAASLRVHGFDTRILDSLATDKSKPLATPDTFSHLNRFYSRSDRSLFCLFHQYRHFGYSFEHIACTVRQAQPFLVGISSLFSAYHDTAMTTARTIRKWNPDIPIVMGGHHPTMFPGEVAASPFVDYVLRGEAEQTLPMLCEALMHHGPLENIPGIAFQAPDNMVIQPPHWTSDLGHLPPAIPGPSAHACYRRKNQGAIVVVSSRGCPMPCSYCSVSASSAHGTFRRRPVAHVIKEIQCQADHQDIGFIDFEDENISFDRSWFLELLAHIKQIFRHKPVELRAMNGLYPPSLDADIIAAMADAGFNTLNLSVGSFSKKQLARFRRPDVRAAHDQAIAWAKMQGLSSVSYVIAGAPDQTASDSLNDLLSLASRPTLAGLSIFYPSPGSLDFNRCKKLGILPDTFSLMRSTAFPVDHTTSRIQAVTLLRLSRILNYMKHLIDYGRHIPEPEPVPGHIPALNPDAGNFFVPDPDTGTLFVPTPDTDTPFVFELKAWDRETISEKLLQWFLYDGKIRGVDNAGQVFVHATDLDLGKAFVRHVFENPLAGVLKGSE